MSRDNISKGKKTELPVQVLTIADLTKVYKILKAFKEGVIVNPSEDWESNYYEESAVDTAGLSSVIKKIEKTIPKEKLLRIQRGKYCSENMTPSAIRLMRRCMKG